MQKKKEKRKWKAMSSCLFALSGSDNKEAMKNNVNVLSRRSKLNKTH